MTEPSSWPPPPEIYNPFAVHDEFLAACVRNSTLKPAVSRLRLTRNLHQETGKDLRYCLAIVNNFCDRHSILMPHTGFRMWLPFLFGSLNVVILLAMNITRHFLARSAASAITHLQRTTFLLERVNLYYVFLAAFFVNASAMVIVVWLREKKVRADAAEAVAKFGGDGVRMK